MYQEIQYREGMEPTVLAQLIQQAVKNNYLVHIKNVPFKETALHAFYEETVNQIGECLALGESVGSAQVAGYWTYVCYDPSIQNAYRSSANAQPLHTDGSYQKESPDATCMYCISNASEGGETTFISGDKLIEALQQEDPALLDQLLTLPVCFSRTFENGENAKTRKIIERDVHNKITLTWNYYRVDPGSTLEVKEMCEKFHQYLQTKIVNSDKLLALQLKPGEAVLWLDERLLHGRNGFTAQHYGDRNLAKACLKLKL